MQVRRLGAEEWSVARAVRLRALADSPEAFHSTHEEELQRPDEWWIAGANRLAWFVAEEGDEVVGVAAGMPGDDGPELISMWVDPGQRGTGAGRALTDAVVGWARSGGASGLCLAVAEGNDRARRLYERAGFVVLGPGEALRSRPEVCTTEMRLTF
ncbi:MAG TPA: GNAT family N-acetyltransferase [Acidimicrobiales bacterium]|nr:GNAT family N-acetyltransferase [Acidimicrobiales bacterium]